MIHLVAMPFGSVTTPGLALAQFKAQLTEAGHQARVFPFNLHFSRLIGPGAYETIARFKGIETQVGEWLFAREAWGRDFGPAEDDFLALCGDEIEGIPHVADLSGWLRKVRHQVVPAFLDTCIDRMAEAGELRVVALSCTFFQTIASLALGRRIRERFPSAKLTYGGACFHGEMGEEIVRCAPWIDAASTGEADDVFVPLVEALLRGEVPRGLQGIHYREVPGGAVRCDAPHTPMTGEQMELVPDPDFDDFFEEAARVGFARDAGWQQRVMLPFESARGCWWGQKQHCTFCGLNGEGMNYRARTADRTLAMFRSLAQKYPQVKRFQAADNIMPMSYFHELLPRMAAAPARPDVEYFWTVKTNLRRDQIRVLADARVLYLQPGIESLADNILKHMRKGVTALQNVCFLRTCQEEGITVYWNNLIRIPGETAEDYAQMVDWLPKLHHLRPAYGGAPKAECHRFSPYFFEANRWASDLRPRAWYAGIYPEDTVDLRRVAYYFSATWRDVLGGSAYDALLTETATWTRAWRDEQVAPHCVVSQLLPDGGVLIDDTRPGRPGTLRLGPEEAALLTLLDTPTSEERLLRVAEKDPERIRALLTTLKDAGLILHDGARYVSVVLRVGTQEIAAHLRSGLLKRITNQSPTSANV